MTEVVGACIAATVLLAVVVVDVLRRHGGMLRRLHQLAPQRFDPGDRPPAADGPSSTLTP